MFWIISLLTFFSALEYTGVEGLYIRSQSMVEVHGGSNVTDFSCHIGGEYFADTVRIEFEDQNNEFGFRNFLFELPVEKFACGNRFLTKDFRKTLCEEDHPRMTVKLKSFKQTRVDKISTIDWGRLEAEFTIAGVTNTYFTEVRRDLLETGFNMNSVSTNV